MACSNSGHTLLGLLINNSPEIIHLGDNLVDKQTRYALPCRCGKQISECENWNIIESFPEHSRLIKGPINPYFYYLYHLYILINLKKHPKALKLFPKQYVFKSYFTRDLYSYHSKIRQLFDKEVFIDGTKRKEVIYMMALKSNGFRIIHLTKSPLDFVYSKLKRESTTLRQIISNSKFDNLYFEKNQTHLQKLVKNILEQYYNYNKFVLAIKEIFDIEYIHIKYEFLCTRTGEELDKLFDFLQVSKLPQYQNFDNNQCLIGARSIVQNFQKINSYSNPKLPRKLQTFVNHQSTEIRKLLDYQTTIF